MEAGADWDNLRAPETYLGYGRGERLASPGGVAFDQRRAYELPEHLPFGHWALAGEWTIGPENVVLDQAGGSIAYRLHAQKVARSPPWQVGLSRITPSRSTTCAPTVREWFRE